MSIPTTFPGPCPHCAARAVFLNAGRFDCAACPWSMPAPWNDQAWRTARRAFLGGITSMRQASARTGDPWRQMACGESIAGFRRTLALLRMQRVDRLSVQHTGQAMAVNAG